LFVRRNRVVGVVYHGANPQFVLWERRRDAQTSCRLAMTLARYGRVRHGN
jgi:hypothetical protein